MVLPNTWGPVPLKSNVAEPVTASTVTRTAMGDPSSSRSTADATTTPPPSPRLAAKRRSMARTAASLARRMAAI